MARLLRLFSNTSKCGRKGLQSKIQKIDWNLQVVRCVVNPYLSSLRVERGDQENTVLVVSLPEIQNDTEGGENVNDQQLYLVYNFWWQRLIRQCVAKLC